MVWVILQGFEPWTHALEGRCSNPTELQNRQTGCKVNQKKWDKQFLSHFLYTLFVEIVVITSHLSPFSL